MVSKHSSTPPADARISEWCLEYLGSRPVETLFRSSHLSTVIGFRLADQRQVVVKVRPDEPRLRECFRIHRYVWESGFPCPEPLAGPGPLGRAIVTAEAFVLRTAPDSMPERFATAAAELLARQVRQCTNIAIETTLEPTPAWVGWDNTGRERWPPPDDVDADLNELAGPEWLDSVADAISPLLKACRLPRVIGHVDWYPENFSWDAAGIKAVYDWDSLALLPEAAIAGGASVLYLAHRGHIPTVGEGEAFIDAYAAARGRAWTSEETRIARAAGLWNLAFDAKKQTVDGIGRGLSQLEESWRERLRLVATS
ncbi:MAG TPA: hypothetical protein VH951_02610 [Dehalococcoidia bacterium]